MDVFVVIGVVAVALMVLALVQLVRFGLRFWRDEVEMEPGGSFGEQLGGKRSRRGSDGER